MFDSSVRVRRESLTPYILLATVFCFPLLSTSAALADTGVEAPRRVVSLNGSSQIAAGRPDQQPARFDRTIPVPGVVDMALPPFESLRMMAGTSSL